MLKLALLVRCAADTGSASVLQDAAVARRGGVTAARASPVEGLRGIARNCSAALFGPLPASRVWLRGTRGGSGSGAAGVGGGATSAAAPSSSDSGGGSGGDAEEGGGFSGSGSGGGTRRASAGVGGAAGSQPGSGSGSGSGRDASPRSHGASFSLE